MFPISVRIEDKVWVRIHCSEACTGKPHRHFFMEILEQHCSTNLTNLVPAAAPPPPHFPAVSSSGAFRWRLDGSILGLTPEFVTVIGKQTTGGFIPTGDCPNLMKLDHHAFGDWAKSALHLLHSTKCKRTAHGKIFGVPHP